jgi:hypothetical protein
MFIRCYNGIRENLSFDDIPQKPFGESDKIENSFEQP